MTWMTGLVDELHNLYTKIVCKCAYDLTKVADKMLYSIMERYMYAACGMSGSEARSVGD